MIALAVTSELVAGAISMGLGGYLSGRVEADTHEAERLRESWEVQHQPKQEEDEVVEVLGRFGLNRQQCEPVLQHFREHLDQWGMWRGGGYLGESRENTESVGSCGGPWVSVFAGQSTAGGVFGWTDPS